MATIRMMQGDTYSLFAALKINGETLTPDMVGDVEITVGSTLRKLYSAGEVLYDKSLSQWYFVPSQQETMAMEPGSYDVQARIKVDNGTNSAVRGVTIGRLLILDALSEEVI